MSTESECVDDCSVTVEASYKFSKRVSTLYKKRYISSFHPRKHTQASKADEGAWAFREDWVKCGGSIQNVGSVDMVSGNLVALMVPEAKPDRLFIMAYFTEYGLLQDGTFPSSKYLPFAEPVRYSRLSRQSRRGE